MGSFNFVTIFLTGLFAGSITCMAVQGGLLTATLAQREEDRVMTLRGKSLLRKSNILPTAAFLISKLIVYTLFGGFLGFIGSLFLVSPQITVVLDIAVFLFMIGTACAMLNIHPLFRYFILQPPHFLSRLIRKEGKRKDIFGSVLVGVLTIFLPCGTTQAMMALAVASGSVLSGAIILFAFTLGTSPVFLLLGYLLTKLGSIFEVKFAKFASLIVVLFAFYNLNNALVLAGSSVTISSTINSINCTISFCPKTYLPPPVSRQTIFIDEAGYSPTNFSVRAGEPVQIRLTNTNGTGCQQAFTIARLNLQEVVTPGQTKILSFVAPKTTEDIPFSCSAGFHPGVIHVVQG